MQLTHWTLQWYTPYSEPGPHWTGRDYTGWPRVILEARLPRGQQLEIPSDLGNGSGWSMYCSLILPERRQLPLATKQRIRRQRLEKRAQVQAPLFAQEIIAAKLASDREYYGSD